ncbi:helix-turn-helix domain-containing protein [Rhizobium sp. CFBP 8762]|uniref:helix-turn-helix domain-containing protein n=1 Tax=Rhizobium sp. CFBP 8762 TaxID=2775279 RepID=UPI001783C1D3|nr:helix-turn-helix domain-containing protein [Rhizobium sp. CFBP 8762]MBD8555531.1 helix-turn-helix domain-containing protein [Rhizobium sp. CFBP 8762]
MIQANGFYLMPTLPRELAGHLKAMPRDKQAWPEDFRKAYDLCHSEFWQAKKEFSTWIRKDRDSRMNRTAKAILLLILDCLNCDTGRCDPSHQFIADEIGISVRTVERTIPRIVASQWLFVLRRGRTTTNFYRICAPVSKVNHILDYSTTLKERRTEEREERRYHHGRLSDPTKMADHSHHEPTKMADHEPTKMAGHEPTQMAGKHMKRTWEDEHGNKGSCSEGSEGTYTHVRTRNESIPDDEAAFSRWINAHIPDRTRHREALKLLRERRMTPEDLRRLAA